MRSTKENEYERESKDKIIEFINVASKRKQQRILYFISECWQAQTVSSLKILRF